MTTHSISSTNGNMSKSEVRGEFSIAVLMAVARLRGEGYGISIQRDLEERLGRDVSFGAVYATLDRLKEKGFVKSRKGEATAARGGRAKIHFKITAPGERALAAARERQLAVAADVFDSDLVPVGGA